MSTVTEKIFKVKKYLRSSLYVLNNSGSTADCKYPWETRERWVGQVQGDWNSCLNLPGNELCDLGHIV